VIRHCEDHLFHAKAFSVQERILYYHLLRHSRLEGQEQVLVSLVPLANALQISESTVRDCIRALHERGCIRIVERSRQGHLIRISLPEEIDGVIPAAAPAVEIKLEELDFFTGRRYIGALIARERGKCFYCFKAIRPETCELDHVQSRANGTDNNYRNIVASCHGCNTTKQATPAQDFVRALYRKGVLSQAELAERLDSLEKLSAGQIQPNLELIRASI
jgi:5-methylcytosine-specific restriction endonuclease McrA